MISNQKVDQEFILEEEDGEIVEDVVKQQRVYPSESLDGNNIPLATAPTIIALSEKFITTRCKSLEHKMRLMKMMGACKREVIRVKLSSAGGGLR